MPQIVAYKDKYTGRYVKIENEGQKPVIVRLDGGRHGPYDKFHLTGRALDDDGKITRIRWQITMEVEGKFPSWISWRCPCCDDPSYQDIENCNCSEGCPNA